MTGRDTTTARVLGGVLTLLGALVASLASASSPSVEGSLPPALAADPRLARRLAYTWSRITLGAAVEHVRRETGAPVSAAPDVAQEPLVAVLSDLPARDPLAQIARLLELDWTTSGGDEGAPAFLLARTAACLRAEERAIQREREEAPSGVLDIFRRVRQYGRLDPDQRREKQRQAAEALGRLREGKTGNPSRHAGAAGLLRELQALGVFSRPHSLLAVELVNSLPEAAMKDLIAGYTVVLSSAPTPGELRLPSRFKERLVALIPAVGSEHGEDAVSLERRELRQGQWRRAEAYRAAISFSVLGNVDRCGVLAARLDPLITGQPPFEVGVSVEVTSPTTRLERVQESGQARAARMGRDPVLGRRARWSAPAATVTTGEVAQQAATLGRVAELFGVSILAQGYRPPWRAALLLEGELALFDALDRLTEDDLKWECDGEVVRIFSPAALYDRRAFVPDAVFAEWRRRRAEGNELTLDEVAAAADSLTDMQLMGGADPYPEARPTLLRELVAFRLDPRALRFWNRLGAVNRRLLRDGRVVPARSLELYQLQALQELNRGMDPFHGTAGISGVIRPRRPPGLLANAGIRLEHRLVSVTNEQGMDETVHRLQPRLIVRLPDGTKDVYQLY